MSSEQPPNERRAAPHAGRPRGTAWRELQAEGIEWEGQILIGEEEEHGLSARLIITAQRLAFARGGEVVLDIERSWLKREPYLSGNGAVNLRIETPSGHRERLPFIARDGRLAATDVVTILTEGAAALPIAPLDPVFTEVPERSASRRRQVAEPGSAPDSPARRDDHKYAADVIDASTLQILDPTDFPPVTEASAPSTSREAQPNGGRYSAEAITISTLGNQHHRQGEWTLDPLQTATPASSRGNRAGWAFRLSGLVVLIALAAAFGAGQLPDAGDLRNSGGSIFAPGNTATSEVAIVDGANEATRSAAQTAAAIGIGGETVVATETPPPTATPVLMTPVPTRTASSTATETATATTVPTQTVTPEPTATETADPTATETAEPTNTETAVPVEGVATATEFSPWLATSTVPAPATSEPTATATSAPTETSTLEPTATETATVAPPTETSTAVPPATSTTEPTATETATSEPSATAAPPTATTALEPTATTAPAEVTTEVSTQEPTATADPTVAPAETAIETETATAEPTATATATAEPTATATATATAEPTATATPEPTATPGFPTQDRTVGNGETPDQVFSTGNIRYTVEYAVRGDEVPTLGLAPTAAGDWVVVVLYAQNWTEEVTTLNMADLQLLVYDLSFGFQFVGLDARSPEIARFLGLDPVLGTSELTAIQPGEGIRLALVYQVPPATSDIELVDDLSGLNLGQSLETGGDVTNLGGAPVRPELIEAVVSEVIDGRTIVVEADGFSATIQYLGVTVPTGAQCYAAEAMTTNSNIVLGETVYLERQYRNRVSSENDVIARDVWIDNNQGGLVLVSAWLASEGAAVPAPANQDVRFAGWIQAAADAAQGNGAGFWAACGGPPVAANGADTLFSTDTVIEPLNRADGFLF